MDETSWSELCSRSLWIFCTLARVFGSALVAYIRLRLLSSCWLWVRLPESSTKLKSLLSLQSENPCNQKMHFSDAAYIWGPTSAHSNNHVCRRCLKIAASNSSDCFFPVSLSDGFHETCFRMSIRSRTQKIYLCDGILRSRSIVTESAPSTDVQWQFLSIAARSRVYLVLE